MMWEKKSLGVIADVYNGNSINADYKKKHFLGLAEGLPFIATKDVLSNGEIDYENGVKVPHDAGLKIAPADSVFVCAEGGSAGKKIAYVKEDVCFGNKLFCILPKNKELYSAKYIYYYCRSDLFRAQFFGELTGLIGGVSAKKFRAIEIPIPPLSEQERIVSLLDAQFAKIDAIKANAEKQLKEAKALFQSALKDYLTPKEGWEEKYLHEISSYYNGLTYKPTDVSNTGTLVLRSSNIQNNCLSLEDKVKVSIDVNEKLKVHKGDIIMCSRNGSKALIGKVALVPHEYSNLTFGTFMMIIKSALNPYLYFYFLSDNFKKQIWKGEANMINQITRYMLDEVLVQYPKNEDEQRRIVKKLHEFSAKIKSLQSNFDTTVTLCNDLKQSILKDIFG